MYGVGGSESSLWAPAHQHPPAEVFLSFYLAIRPQKSAIPPKIPRGMFDADGEKERGF